MVVRFKTLFEKIRRFVGRDDGLVPMKYSVMLALVLVTVFLANNQLVGAGIQLVGAGAKLVGEWGGSLLGDFADIL